LEAAIGSVVYAPETPRRRVCEMGGLNPLRDVQATALIDEVEPAAPVHLHVVARYPPVPGRRLRQEWATSRGACGLATAGPCPLITAEGGPIPRP